MRTKTSNKTKIKNEMKLSYFDSMSILKKNEEFFWLKVMFLLKRNLNVVYSLLNKELFLFEILSVFRPKMNQDDLNKSHICVPLRAMHSIPHENVHFDFGSKHQNIYTYTNDETV